MKETLNIVRGAVAKKDLVPVLTHFRIYNNRIQGANGKLAIDCAFPYLNKADITVPAEDFIRAVDVFDGEFSIKLKDGFLFLSKTINKKRTNIKLPLYDNEAYPETGITVGKKIKGFDYRAFSKARKFVSEDASRPWSCGILVTNDYLYSTNNVVLTRVKHNKKMKDRINVPAFTIDEVLRIDYEIDEIIIGEQHITFLYGDEFYITSNTYVDEWPDIETYFKYNYENLPKVEEGLLDA